MVDDVSRRNAKLVVAASFFGDFAFVLPIWLLYSTDHLHFSTTLSVVLFTGVWFVSALFEIPTGALADKWGRKATFMTGNLLLLFYPLAYVFGAPLWLFFPILVLGGFGNSLTSGALLPLVHESYEKAGLGKKEYHKFLTKSRTVLFIARALSGVVGAWLYTIKPYLPFVGWALAIVCNIIIGSKLVEKRSIDTSSTYRAHIGSALRAIKQSEMIVVMLAGYITINAVAEAIWTGYQLFYHHDGRSALLIGLLFSLIAVFSALASYGVRKLYTRFSPVALLFFSSCLVTVTSFLLYQPNDSLRLTAIVPMAIASGIMAVTISAVVQHIIPNKIQSTALSVYSVITYVVYAFGSLWLGWAYDKFGDATSRRIILASSVGALFFMALLTLKITRKNKFRLEEKEFV